MRKRYSVEEKMEMVEKAIEWKLTKSYTLEMSAKYLKVSAMSLCNWGKQYMKKDYYHAFSGSPRTSIFCGNNFR